MGTATNQAGQEAASGFVLAVENLYLVTNYDDLDCDSLVDDLVEPGFDGYAPIAVSPGDFGPSFFCTPEGWQGIKMSSFKEFEVASDGPPDAVNGWALSRAGSPHYLLAFGPLTKTMENEGDKIRIKLTVKGHGVECVCVP